MKIRNLLAVVAGIGMVVAVDAAPLSAAAKPATVKVVLTGDCADGEHVEDADEDDCEILVTVTPKNKNVSARLEVAYDEEEPDWEEMDSGKTRGGRLIFSVPATDEDGVWMDGVVRYRVAVRKAAGVRLPKMRDYRVEYVSAEAAEGDEDLAEEMAEDKEFNEEMDKAQQENKQFIQQQQPNSDIKQGGQTQGSGGFSKSAEFNRACGAISFPQADCQKLIDTKSPSDAEKILGSKAEAWCTALAAPPAGMKVPCSMVLPRVFPPING
jgi:hypothetical protein